MISWYFVVVGSVHLLIIHSCVCSVFLLSCHFRSSYSSTTTPIKWPSPAHPITFTLRLVWQRINFSLTFLSVSRASGFKPGHLLGLQTVMAALAASGIQLYPVNDFDQIVAIRAERHEDLRGRNNVTSCRSPTRGLNTRLIKDELKKKRQQEFLKRRSVSPERSGSKSTNRFFKTKLSTPFSMTHHSSISKSETFYTNIQNTLTANGHPVMILTPHSSVTDGPSTSNWVNTQPLILILVLFHQIHVSPFHFLHFLLSPPFVRPPHGQNRYHWRGKRKARQGRKHLPPRTSTWKAWKRKRIEVMVNFFSVAWHFDTSFLLFYYKNGVWLFLFLFCCLSKLKGQASRHSSKQKRFTRKSPSKQKRLSKKGKCVRPVCRQSEFNSNLLETLIKTSNLKCFIRDSWDQCFIFL